MAQGSTMEFLGHHPVIGAIVSGAHVGIGFLLQSPHLELPIIVMQLFQIGAWTVAMLAGSFTIYGVWKKHHGKTPKK